jgi:ATP-dependent exoDNAse (exonuclease V) alpha subunit
VLVVDEASMADTRTLAELLARTQAAGGTLVLVGDPAQLPEIGAGGVFAALARHPGTVVLTDNRRQTEAWERAALGDLRAGDPDAALEPTSATAASTPRPGRSCPAYSFRTTCGSRKPVRRTPSPTATRW